MRCTPVLAVVLSGCCLFSGVALAQGAPTAGAPAVTATPVPATASGVVGTVQALAPGTVPGSPLPVGRNGPVTAGMTFGGPQPRPGRNSFTRVQAARRIEHAGFTGVTGLQEDAQGIWRGHATRAGAPAAVWLDYTGKVGVS
ncbi:MAG: hypothetical protein ACRYHQ_41820 [Janthinobacterium lividum]